MTTGTTRAAIALIALTWVSGWPAACSPRGPAGDAAPAAIPAPVASPLVEKVVDWESYSGRFEASQRVEVRARVSGYLEAVHFRDGERVGAGDLLFTIDPRPYEAAIQVAEGDLSRTEAEVAQAERDVERARRLAASDTISEQVLETARTTLKQAQASQAAAAATLRERQLDLDFTRINSPIPGRTSDTRVDPGNLVTENGQTLTTIVATDPMYFELDVPESALLAYLRTPHELGDEDVQVRLQGETGYGWRGRITFADNVVDPATGTIRIRADIANPEGFLRPGMYGDARVRTSAPYDAILVPQSAVLADATRRLVYVLDDEDAVQARPVVLGALSGDLWVVKAGLAADDRVVVNGIQRVRPGAVVAPQPAEITRGEPAEPEAAVEASDAYGANTASNAIAVPVQN